MNTERHRMIGIPFLCFFEELNQTVFTEIMTTFQHTNRTLQ